MDEWHNYRLEEISNRITERVGDKELPTLSISAGIGFVSQEQKFSRDISGKQYKNYIHIKKGDFSYNKGNSKKFPQGCIYELLEYAEAAVPNTFISFRFKDSYVSGFYKGYFENNFHGIQLVKYITSGARMDGLLNINPSDFFNIILPTPIKKKEQQKIADCLSSIDDLISAEEKKLSLLNDYKKGWMQKLFPAEGKTIPEWRFPEFRDSGDWENTTIEKIADYENGKAHENNIIDNGKYIVVNSKFISTEGEIIKYTNEANLLAYKGDILMVLSDVPNGRALSKCYLVEKDNVYTVNQRVCRIIPEKVNSTLLFYTINRNKYFLSFDDGVKQTNLKKNDVLSCSIVIPKEPDEQEKIADFLSGIDELISSQKEKIEKLKQHKIALMQGLFPAVEEVL